MLASFVGSPTTQTQTQKTSTNGSLLLGSSLMLSVLQLLTFYENWHNAC